MFFDGPFVALAVWSPGVPVVGEMEYEREEDTERMRTNGGSEGKIEQPHSERWGTTWDP